MVERNKEGELLASEKKYTVQEANELLPWLTEQLTQALDLGKGLAQHQSELKELQSHARRNGSGDTGPKIAEAEQTVTRELEKVQKVVQEIQDKGIQVRDLNTGLVDFPSELGDRKIWLCWRIGEPEVGYYHELYSGFSSRKPLE